MAATPPVVSDEDVLALLTGLKPGREYLAEHLYERYAELMTAAGRPAGSRTALGRALTRYGCQHHIVRKGRGRRGEQTRTDTPVWTLPNEDGSIPDDPITILVKRMGPGLHPVDLVYRRYLGLKHVAVPLTRVTLMTRLTQRGYPAVRDKRRGQKGSGEPCRLF